jgi:thioredoxin 1
LLLVSAVAAVIVLKKKENQPLQTQTNVNNPQPVVVEANKTQKLPRLVDLGADKCIPCKMMKPVLDELGTEYKGILDVVFIDVWKDEAAGKKFGIRVIPTQIFLDPDGKELFRHEGFFSKEDILAKWKKLGFEIKKKD